MVKLAYKHEVWDVAFVAAQMCLSHDDGRWKGMQFEHVIVTGPCTRIKLIPPIVVGMF